MKLMKVLALVWLFAHCASAEIGKLVFACDFSDGFTPQVTAAPVKVYSKFAKIVETSSGKAAQFGKFPDGQIAYVSYRPDNPDALETPFPLRYGRIEFRFRAVDWKLGDPPFQMLVNMHGPLGSKIHFVYTRPTSSGIPSLQMAYGQQKNPTLAKGTLPVLFPLVRLNPENEWHTVVCDWSPEVLNMNIDGESLATSTRFLAPIAGSFYAEALEVGSYAESLQRGTTEIADLKIYSTMPEISVADQPTRFPELLIPRISQAPAIDGTIHADEYAGFAAATGFVKLPSERITAHQPVFRIAYDDKAFYLAVSSPEIGRMPQTNITRRDGNVWEDDGIEFFLVPERAKTGDFYQIIANYAGVIFDQFMRPGQSPAECIAWNGPNIRTASKVQADGTWHLEMIIPFADLGLTMPAPGEKMFFNLCQTIQGQGAYSIAPVHHGYAEPEKFGLLTFGDEKSPVVSFDSIGDLAYGDAKLEVRVRNAPRARLEVNAMRYDETAQTEFPLFGTMADANNENTIRMQIDSGRLGKNGTLYANLLHLNKRIYAGKFSYEVSGEAEIETLRRIIVDGRNFLKVSTAQGAGKSKELLFSVMDKAGKVALTKKAAITSDRQDTLLDISTLAPGQYQVKFEVLGGVEKVTAEARDFTVYPENVPWRNFPLAQADHVPAPWTPLQYAVTNGQVIVQCWNRTYTFGAQSLFAEQITSADKQLLAKPIELDLEVEGKPVRADRVKIEIISADERSIMLQATSDAAGIGKFSVRATIEYDGFIWYDLEIPSLEGKTINRLAVRLTMPNAVSGLLNSGDRDLRNTGFTPQAWSKCMADTFGSFWIGSETGGLSFGIESAQNWRNQDAGKQADVMRKTGSDATISLNIIDTPSTLRKIVPWGFYMHPTPVKPTTPGYRKLRANSWFGHNRDILYNKGYPTNLSWWMTSYTFQGYPQYVTNKEEVRELQAKRVNFGYVVRDYNHYDTLDKRTTRSAWYAAYSSIGRNAPEVIWSGEEWRAGQRDKLYGNTLYDYTMDMIEVCKTKDYTDFYLWRVHQSKLEQEKVDGLYFDLMFFPGCDREDHNHGYTDENGRRQQTWPLREHRRWLERIYIYLHEHADNAPLVTHLSGATSRVAGFSWADYFLDGELWQQKLVQDRAYKAMSLDMMRAEVSPRIYGPGLIWLSQLYRIRPFVPASQRAKWSVEPYAERHLAGMLLLHDVIPDRTSQNDAALQVWNVLDRFDLDDSDTMCYYYEHDNPWRDNADKTSTAVGAFIKKDASKMLLELFNNRDEAFTFRITLDSAKAFGKNCEYLVINAESGQKIYQGNGEFTATLPMRDYCLLEIQPIQK